MFQTLVVDGVEWKYKYGNVFLVIKKPDYQLCTPIIDVTPEKRLTTRAIEAYVRREKLNDVHR
jgi:hypothetical protein